MSRPTHIFSRAEDRDANPAPRGNRTLEGLPPSVRSFASTYDGRQERRAKEAERRATEASRRTEKEAQKAVRQAAHLQRLKEAADRKAAKAAARGRGGWGGGRGRGGAAGGGRDGHGWHSGPVEGGPERRWGREDRGAGDAASADTYLPERYSQESPRRGGPQSDHPNQRAGEEEPNSSQLRRSPRKDRAYSPSAPVHADAATTPRHIRYDASASLEDRRQAPTSSWKPEGAERMDEEGYFSNPRSDNLQCTMFSSGASRGRFGGANAEAGPSRPNPRNGYQLPARPVNGYGHGHGHGSRHSRASEEWARAGGSRDVVGYDSAVDKYVAAALSPVSLMSDRPYATPLTPPPPDPPASSTDALEARPATRRAPTPQKPAGPSHDRPSVNHAPQSRKIPAAPVPAPGKPPESISAPAPAPAVKVQKLSFRARNPNAVRLPSLPPTAIDPAPTTDPPPNRPATPPLPPTSTVAHHSTTSWAVAPPPHVAFDAGDEMSGSGSGPAGAGRRPDDTTAGEKGRGKGKGKARAKAATGAGDDIDELEDEEDAGADRKPDILRLEEKSRKVGGTKRAGLNTAAGRVAAQEQEREHDAIGADVEDRKPTVEQLQRLIKQPNTTSEDQDGSTVASGTDWVRRSDVPLQCYGPHKAEARAQFVAARRKKLLAAGKIPGPLRWRDDGMTIDWTAALPPAATKGSVPARASSFEPESSLEPVPIPIAVTTRGTEPFLTPSSASYALRDADPPAAHTAEAGPSNSAPTAVSAEQQSTDDQLRKKKKKKPSVKAIEKKRNVLLGIMAQLRATIKQKEDQIRAVQASTMVPDSHRQQSTATIRDAIERARAELEQRRSECEDLGRHAGTEAFAGDAIVASAQDGVGETSIGSARGKRKRENGLEIEVTGRRRTHSSTSPSKAPQQLKDANGDMEPQSRDAETSRPAPRSTVTGSAGEAYPQVRNPSLTPATIMTAASMRASPSFAFPITASESSSAAAPALAGPPRASSSSIDGPSAPSLARASASVDASPAGSVSLTDLETQLFAKLSGIDRWTRMMDQYPDRAAELQRQVERSEGEIFGLEEKIRRLKGG